MGMYGLYEPALDYYRLFTSMLKISSVYIDALYDVLSKNCRDFNEFLMLIDKRLDEELRGDSFTQALADYVDSWFNIHRVLRSMYPIIKYTDAMLEGMMYIAFNYYTSTLAFILSTYRELDSTPYEVIWQRGKSRLIHYLGSIDKKPPILIVYAMINRYHIMDISKEKSVVKRLMENGMDVYLLDWGHITYEDDTLSLKYYVECIEHAVERIVEVSKHDKVSLLGYCWGGIPVLVYASLHKERLSSIIVMATPVDASKDHGTLARWAKGIDAKSIVDEYGHMNGQVLDIAFFMRNPVRYGILKYTNLWKRLDDKAFVDTFVAVERWLYNTPFIPGRLYEQMIEYCYKRNVLISDKANIDGIDFSLKDIDIPLFVIVAENDDLTSPESTLEVTRHVSSKDKGILKIPGGHVGLCISTIAHKSLWPEVARWVKSKSKAMEGANHE